MKKHFIILLLFSWIPHNKLSACLNEYRTLLSGEVIHTRPFDGKVWVKTVDTLKFRQEASQLLLRYQETDSLAYLSDYAVALTYLGEYEKAKDVYLKIEQSSPNLYRTASNLGTLYELLGQVDSALVQIRKSVELNPNSHNGSEWVHIKILEFKLSGGNGRSVSVLDLDFGMDRIPFNPNGYDLDKLQKDIWWQLRERVPLVQPEDIIVGNLYFDLGNVLAQTKDVQAAIGSYEEALRYGFSSPVLDNRMAEFRKLALRAKPNELKEALKQFVKDNIWAIFASGVIGLLLALVLGIKFVINRGWFK